MKIDVNNLESTKVRLTVTAEKDDLTSYLDKAREEIGKHANIPGFRKGHVPGKIIDQRFGYSAVVSEALNEAVPALYENAVRSENLRPMDQPQFNVEEIPTSATDDSVLKFTAEVEIRPKFELPELDGMTVEISKLEVKEEDVDRRLEALRQRFGSLVGVDRPAAEGDYANINLEASIDGEVVDSQEGVSYELGSGTMLDGLDEALNGLSAGEETTFEGTLEGGEHEGEKAQIKVVLNSVKTEELPELDDDFAADASEFDTLEVLKADMRKAAQQDAAARQANEGRDAFLELLQKDIEIDVPKGVKERTVEEHLKTAGDPAKITDEQKAEIESSTETEIRNQMLLDALAEKMEVNVSQADVTNFLVSVAQQYGMDPSAFIQSIVSGGRLPSAVQEVARSKGLIAAMRAVSFKDTDGSDVDLSQFLRTEEDEANESIQAAQAAAKAAAEAVSNAKNSAEDEESSEE